MISDTERYLGCLLGLAVGDALGTTVEFSPRGSFPPLTDMIGGGPFAHSTSRQDSGPMMLSEISASLGHAAQL